jgi:hypothetical protein
LIWFAGAATLLTRFAINLRGLYRLRKASDAVTNAGYSRMWPGSDGAFGLSRCVTPGTHQFERGRSPSAATGATMIVRRTQGLIALCRPSAVVAPDITRPVRNTNSGGSTGPGRHPLNLAPGKLHHTYIEFREPAITLAATRLMGSLLFGLQARDFATLTISAALLAAVSFAASYLAARRAARLDPRHD